MDLKMTPDVFWMDPEMTINGSRMNSKMIPDEFENEPKMTSDGLYLTLMDGSWMARHTLLVNGFSSIDGIEMAGLVMRKLFFDIYGFTIERNHCGSKGYTWL